MEEIDISFTSTIAKRGRNLMIHIPRNMQEAVEKERQNNPTVNVGLSFVYKERWKNEKNNE